MGLGGTELVVAGEKMKLGVACLGFLEVMVSNACCQGYSCWVTWLSASVWVLAEC